MGFVSELESKYSPFFFSIFCPTAGAARPARARSSQAFLIRFFDLEPQKASKRVMLKGS